MNTFRAIAPDRVGLLIASAVLLILVPLIVVIAIERRLRPGWRYIGFGALVFLVFQMLTRVPLVTLAQVGLAGWIAASATNQIIWVLALSLTAGLFEEIGRYIGYRLLMRNEPKDWRKAVLYGTGHGGFEALVLIGALGLIQIVSLLTIIPAAFPSLPPDQQTVVQAQYDAINAVPPLALFAGVWERLCAMALHIALSVVVLQAVLRRQAGWLALSVVLHTLFNALTLLIPGYLVAPEWRPLATALLLGAMGALAVWGTFRLRRATPQDSL